MASEVIAFQVNLRKNNNRFNKGYGKYYPEADSKEPLNLKGFVKLDGFGTFSPSIESDGTKAVSSVEESMNVGIDNLIAGVHLRFTPENSKGEALTSRALKKECQFKAAYVIAAKKKEIDGKTVSYQEKIPISSFAVATHQEGGE